MDPRALFASFLLMASAAIATAGGPSNVAWPPFMFLIGLAVLALAALARRRGEPVPFRRLTGLTVLALVIASLSALGEAELGGLGMIDLIALAVVLGSVLVITLPQRAGRGSVRGTTA
jgi:predicted acyltransferase